MAMFNGTLDPPTPLEHALTAKGAYAGPAQHFFVVPGASHGAIGGEPWSKPVPPCSVRLAVAFVGDPEAVPDPSCFADVDPPGFEASAVTALAFFGTSDAWGDSAAPGIVAPEVLADAAAERQRLAARFRAMLRAH